MGRWTRWTDSGRVSVLVLGVFFVATAVAAADVGCCPEEGSRAPLGAAEVERLEAATVYLPGPNRTGLGSGFLFRRTAAEPILIATGYRVLRSGLLQILAPSRVRVVLHAGTPREQLHIARVVALSPHDDVAILRLEESVDEPGSFELSSETVSESQLVRVVGFPFGEEVKSGEGAPSPTVATGTVSGLRRNEDGSLDRVQLDVHVDPGNRGGPVVDLQGRVVGMAVETVLTAGVSFMIPVESLHRLLEGSVSNLGHEVEGSTLLVRLLVENPLTNITEVGLNALPSKKAPVGTARRRPFPVAGQKLTSRPPIRGRRLDLEASLLRYRDRPVWILPWFRRGGALVGLTPFQVDLRPGLRAVARARPVKGKTPQKVRGKERPSGWLEASKEAATVGRKPETTRKELGGDLQEFGDARVREVLGVGARLADLTFSPDGEFVYLLEETGILRKVHTETLLEERKLELGAATNSVVLSAQGLVVGLPAVRELLVVSPKSLEPVKAIPVPVVGAIASSPELDVAFTIAIEGQALYWIDLERGEAIGELRLQEVKEATTCARSSLPSGHHLSDRVRALAALPNGKHLLMVLANSLVRFRIQDRRLICEEIGPELGHVGPSEISLSPGGFYVAYPTAGGNRTLLTSVQPSHVAHIFRVDRLGEPVLTIETRDLKRLGFEIQRGWIVGLGHNDDLRVFNSGGAVVAEIPLFTHGDPLRAVHGSPRGEVVFLRTAERLLWLRFE